MSLRIMAIGAHPDDVEILAAGTLARYRERGHAIAVCILTDGRLGAPSGDPDDVAATRREEAQAAAHLLGAELFWIGQPDGMLFDNPETRSATVEAVREFAPNILFAHDPSDYHPDHRAASAIAMSARQLATAPLFATDSRPLSTAPSVYYMDPLGLVGDAPELWVDISSTVDIKRQMLWCHKSQNEWLQNTDGIDYVTFVDRQGQIRGLQCGVSYAEGFRAARTYPIETGCNGLPAL